MACDVRDIRLQNKVVEMEAIEQDLERGIPFAVFLDGDPGRDSGVLQQRFNGSSSDRFFFRSMKWSP